MAGRKALAITERQYEVLTLLWDHGPMTVRDVLDRLPRAGRPPYTTVLGLLQNMEKAALVTHDEVGAAHRYRPLVTRTEATGNLLTDFLNRFFRGSAERLVLGLVDAERFSPDDLKAIEARLAESGPAPSPKPARRRRKK